MSLVSFKQILGYVRGFQMTHSNIQMAQVCLTWERIFRRHSHCLSRQLEGVRHHRYSLPAAQCLSRQTLKERVQTHV